MNAARNTILLASLSFLGACTSPDLPPMPEPEPPPVAVVVPAAPTDPALLAPVDRWRRELADLLPAPWRFERLDAQVIAPEGWTRVAGDRGLALWLTDGQRRQVFWVMPTAFEGKVVDDGIAAQPQAKNKTFVLYQPKTLAAGFKATGEVATALGMGRAGGHSPLSRARRDARVAMRSLCAAIERFKADVGCYPVHLSDLWETPRGEIGWKGPYCESDPRDPWGSEFAYTSTMDSFEISTYGADGAPGGEGPDMDLSTQASLQK